MFISIDLGGTTTRVASSKDLHNIEEVVKFPTDADLSALRYNISDNIKKMVGNDTVEYVCIGVPGMVDRENSKFKKIVNYPQLDGMGFSELFDIENCKYLTAENDAALAGLAEANRGEAANYGIVAYITLSTGVGGVRIKHKKLDLHVDINEPGHMVIVEGGIHDDICGQNGCLHAYLSGAMFKKVYGKDPRFAKSNEIWEKYGSHLATGVINIIAMWDPDIIVFGGGISEKFDLFSPKMFEKLKAQDLLEVPHIVKSQLGDNNGLLGGFDLIKQLRL